MSALLTDLYQLRMMQAYHEEGLQERATFELFVRQLPPTRNFLVAAGLGPALEWLQSLHFEPDELDWLAGPGGFSTRFVQWLAAFRFEGDVHAMPEGSVFFAGEPILRVSAPLPQAQLVESRLLNIVHFQTLIASKAARMVLAARGRGLVDFGLRRAHGADAALMAARAAWLAGFDGTATVEAGRRFTIPVVGTMAHAYVQAHATERGAFDAFAHAWPQRPTLLIDTYDTERGAARVVALAPGWRREGIEPGAVRLDSGDLAAHARAVRAVLDDGGLRSTRILASGNIDEWRIEDLVRQGAPIDSFGVGTALDTSSDAPSLDAVYKLQAYAGRARRKRSEGKATWPGLKQVCRQVGPDGQWMGDRIQLEDEPLMGEALLQPIMAGGRRLPSADDADRALAQARRHCATQLAALPEPLRALTPTSAAYTVEVSDGLRRLAREVDACAD